MIGLLAAVALAAAPAPGLDCGLTRLDACRDTNLLAWDRAFDRAVRAFVGPGRADYLYRGRLTDQQLDVLGGPPDDPVRIGDLYRFTACRQHSCGEKGAVVLQPDGRIVATAILHTTCVTQRADDCTDENILTVFARDPARAKPVIDNLVAWARDEVDGRAAGEPYHRSRLAAVEVYLAGKGVATPVSRESLVAP